jgi:hypothetical protein
MHGRLTWAIILGAQMGTLLHAQGPTTQQLRDKITGPLGRTELVATVGKLPPRLFFESAPVALNQSARRRVPPEVGTGAAIVR